MRPSPAEIAASPSDVNRAPLSSSRLDRLAVTVVKRMVQTAPIRFVLWDGFELPSTSGPAVATVRFRDRSALMGWVWDPELNFGEAYMSGGVDIDGDLLALLEAVYRSLHTPARSWRRSESANNPSAARQNVHQHYDLGNDFYELWLDRELLYSCAYFRTPLDTLETAQTAKMDLVCRKLRLHPGERVVEAGCGWGALALYMARNYGATVRAFNVSSEQIAYARARARLEHLDTRVEFVGDDYREIRGSCDAFVSVGMLEHVGEHDFGTLGSVMNRTLTSNGRGFLHFIGRNRHAALNPWIRKRIFPGAYPPTLPEVFTRVLEPHDFSVLDVENLRLHYARTVDHWRRRFEASARRVGAMFDEPFVRAWRLYLAGSQAAFTTGWMQLFQVVFARGANNRIPWTRATS